MEAMGIVEVAEIMLLIFILQASQILPIAVFSALIIYRQIQHAQGMLAGAAAVAAVLVVAVVLVLAVLVAAAAVVVLADKAVMADRAAMVEVLLLRSTSMTVRFFQS
jgi:hypothetical protein